MGTHQVNPISDAYLQQQAASEQAFVPKSYQIHYQVDFSKPYQHLIEVTLTLLTPCANGQILFMPSWLPGSYKIRDFAQHVTSISAESSQGDVKVTQLDKSHWQCDPVPKGEALTVRYQVFAWDQSVRGAHFDQQHAYFNGSCLFLAVKGQEDQPVSVDLQQPDFTDAKDWRVATSLACQPTTKEYDFGRYWAMHYDELIDHPVEIANFEQVEFLVAGIKHELIVTGRAHLNMNRIALDLEKICQYQVDLFGELPPMKKYVFFLWVVENGFGGLEHRASTSLMYSRRAIDWIDETHEGELPDSYIDLLALCSHEYFHTWNIKRIKPKVFVPYALEQETYTEQLWAYEGITSYYDELTLKKVGLISSEKYLEMLSKTITRVQRYAGESRQTVTVSSLEAWTKFYQQHEHSMNSIVSYYTKGSLVALCLDWYIRKASNQEKSLDDFMRELWLRYGKPGIGTQDESFADLLVELTADEKSRGFLNQMLYTVARAPIDEFAETFGLSLVERPMTCEDDQGGKAKTEQATAVLGVKLKPGPALVLGHIFEGGNAQQAGLTTQDEVIAFDGIRVNPQNWKHFFQQRKDGDQIEVLYARNGLICKTQLSYQLDTLKSYDLQAKDLADARLLKWLNAS